MVSQGVVLVFCLAAVAVALPSFDTGIRKTVPGSTKEWDLYIPKYQMNWPAAYQFCRAANYALLSLASAKLDNEVIEMLDIMQLRNETLWISATDWLSEGNFTWMATGNPVDVDGWLKGQPNGGEKENCVVLEEDDLAGYGWQDTDCSRELYFMCERGQPEF